MIRLLFRVAPRIGDWRLDPSSDRSKTVGLQPLSSLRAFSPRVVVSGGWLRPRLDDHGGMTALLDDSTVSVAATAPISPSAVRRCAVGPAAAVVRRSWPPADHLARVVESVVLGRRGRDDHVGQRPIGTLFAELRQRRRGARPVLPRHALLDRGVRRVRALDPAPSALAVGVAGRRNRGAGRPARRSPLRNPGGSRLRGASAHHFLATEARSYAIGTAIAVWITVYFVGLLRRRESRLRPWLVLGADRRAGELPVPVPGAARGRLGAVDHRLVVGIVGIWALRWRWAQLARVTAVVAAPIALLAYSERHQVAFLAKRGYAHPGERARRRSGSAARRGGIGSRSSAGRSSCSASAIVIARTVRRSPDRRAREPQLRSRGAAARSRLARASRPRCCWSATTVSPMYNIRYLSFCTPAAALLIAFGVVAAGRLAPAPCCASRRAARRRARGDPALAARRASLTVALVLLAALPSPCFRATWLSADRSPKNGGSDWRQTAEYVAGASPAGRRRRLRPDHEAVAATRARLPDCIRSSSPAVTVPEVLTPYYRRAAHLGPDGARSRRSAPSWHRRRVGVGRRTAHRNGVPEDIEDLTDARLSRVVSTHLVHRLVVYQLQKESAVSESIVVVLPTYNERENLEGMVRRLRAQRAGCRPPDRRRRVARRHGRARAGAGGIRLRRSTCCSGRPKQGLGAAYLAGFAWALERGAEVIVECDADGSHQPEELPRLLAALPGHDLVVGSRWVRGGRIVNWPLSRRAAVARRQPVRAHAAAAARAGRDRRVPGLPCRRAARHRTRAGRQPGLLLSDRDAVARRTRGTAGRRGADHLRRARARASRR